MKRLLSLLALITLCISTLFAQTTAVELPKAPDHYERGVRYFNYRRYRQAARYFELDLEEGHVLRIDTFIYLIKCYEAREEYEKVLPIARKGIRITQDYYELFSSKANAHYHLGEYTKAILSIQYAMQLRPRDPSLYHLNGLIQLSMKQYREAIEALLIATEIDKENALYIHDLGMVYEAQKKYEKALEYYERAYEQDRRFWRARNSFRRLTREYQQILREREAESNAQAEAARRATETNE